MKNPNSYNSFNSRESHYVYVKNTCELNPDGILTDTEQIQTYKFNLQQRSRHWLYKRELIDKYCNLEKQPQKFSSKKWRRHLTINLHWLKTTVSNDAKTWKLKIWSRHWFATLVYLKLQPKKKKKEKDPDTEFFLNGAELSVNSGNLINHWNMNWAQFKDPVSHISCWHCGSILASHTRGCLVAGSSPFK